MNARNHIPWLKVVKNLAAGRVPGQAVIQFTDACNARCGHCGMSLENRFPRTKLAPERVKGLIDKLAARGVLAASFTGGEPLLYLDEVAECIRYARKAGMRSVRTGTNGFFLRGADEPGFRERVGRYAATLAESGCTAFWISLDSSSAPEHETHRGLTGVVRGMREGLPIFHERGLFPAANLCINRRMDGLSEPENPGAPFDPQAFYERFRRAFMLYFAQVKELGFTSANVCHPMLGDAFGAGEIIYQAASNEDFIRFRPEEKAPLYRALMDAVSFFRPRLRIFTPQSTLLSMIRAAQGDPRQGYPCRGGLDFFFVDAAGMRVFPCGYRGGEDLSDLVKSGRKTDGGESCERCDWECFRDPSHLFGPLREFFTSPAALVRRFARDPEWAKLWFGDLRYLRSCGWFDARRPPSPSTNSSRRIHRPVNTSAAKGAIEKSW